MSAAARVDAALAAALAKACRLDVVAFKPGNVSLCSAGHGMQARDFLASARAAVPHLAAARASVGERIERAVRATHAEVGCNTNLGIVLLLAPLAAAALEPRAAPLARRLAHVLDGLTRDDAVHCYRAIRCARPGGLGTAGAEDVRGEPTVTLREAMGLAADRDRVARQYVTGFADVLGTGLGALAGYRARWRSLAAATTGCYVSLLAAWPDSHVVRKHGAAVAERLRARAGEVESALKACENPRSLSPVLTGFDDELKAGGVNPGTTADLTVASVAVWLFGERLMIQ